MAVVVVDAAFVVGDLGHGPELLAAKHPLKRRVVNADHAAGLLEEGVVGVTGFQQQWQQARCQSLQWAISGASQAARRHGVAAAEKKAKRSPLSG